MAPGISKIADSRIHLALNELATQPGNDICADCKEPHPRWASYSLGIFICVHCASIHRKMGTHISKVKSLTLDSWSRAELEVMREQGNIKSNTLYNPDETRHPPPTNMVDQERDSDLEKYIRGKYQYKSFMSRSAQVAALLGPSQSASRRLSPAPSVIDSPSPPTTSSPPTSASSPPTSAFSPPTSTSSPNERAALQVQSDAPLRSVSQPAPPLPLQPLHAPSAIWHDLAQLQGPTSDSSLPLQYADPAALPSLPNTGPGTAYSAPAQQGGLWSTSLGPGLSLTPHTGMPGMSPSMAHPSSFAAGEQTMHTVPSPSPFVPHTLPSPVLGTQQQPAYTSAPPPFGQAPMLASLPPPHGSPLFMGQGAQTFMAQPLAFAQGAQMFQPQLQEQVLQTQFPNQYQQGTAPFGQSPQTQMFAQPGATYAYAGQLVWQPTGFPGQQQQQQQQQPWGGM